MAHSKKIKIFLLTVLILICASSIGLLVVMRGLNKGPERALSYLPFDVDMHLNGVDYVEVKEGRKEWALKADSLKYSKSNQLIEFDHVKLAFFDANRGRIDVFGDKAEYDRETQIVQLIGSVRITDLQGYKLQATLLKYDVNAKLFQIEGFFSLIGPTISIDGTGLTVEIDNRLLKIHKTAKVTYKST